MIKLNLKPENLEIGAIAKKRFDEGNMEEKCWEKKEDSVTIITIINTNTNKLYTKCIPPLLIIADHI